MKRFLFFLIPACLSLAIQTELHAQAQFWGTTTYGGPAGTGVIFKTNKDGTGYAVQKNFIVETSGATPFFTQFVEAANGKLYGLTAYGGVNNQGVLFEFDPSNGIYTNKFDFDGAVSGANPSASLVAAPNGRLYGMTLGGGTCNNGLLFEFNPANGNFLKILDFCGANGAFPYSSMTVAVNGKLYGMTSSGGVFGTGVLFEYDLSNGSYIDKFDFDYSATGGYPLGGLLQASDGKLYGMAAFGGAFGGGTLFSFDPANGNFDKRLDFESLANGSSLYGTPAQAGNGKLYGMTSQGGVNGAGVLFEFDPGTSAFDKKHEFGSGSDGSLPFGNSLALSANGKMYGLTTYGGINDKGTLFELDPATGAYNKMTDFDSNSTGANPDGSLVEASNGKLYGMTSAGGTEGLGLIFEFNHNTGAFAVKGNFGASLEGAGPQGSLVPGNDNKLYGMTSHGGANGKGVLFEYDRVAGNYVKRFEFSETNGSYPLGKLTLADDANYYGMTSEGGANSYGVLFQYDPLHNSFTKIIDFDNATKGASPHDNNLVQLSGKLYGAIEGGANGAGVLFCYDPFSMNYSVKVVLESVSTGGKPTGTLAVGSNGKLYGMTLIGGANQLGTLFEYDPIGGVLTKMIDFDLTTGAYPAGSLVAALNGKLYGVTTQGGANGEGTMFEFNPANGNFTKKYDFPASVSSSGDWPLHGLTLAPTGKIYATTTYGANNNVGALYEFDPSNSSLLKRHDFSAATGSSPLGAALTMVDADQTISFNTIPPKTIGDPPFSLVAASSSLLPVTFSSSNSSIASVSGDVVTIHKAGTCTITVHQAGNADFFPADVSQQFTVGKLTPTVSWASPADIQFGTGLTATQLDATASVPGVFTYVPAAGVILDVGIQSLTAHFVPGDTTNYNSVDVQTLITVEKANQTITFTIPDKTIGDPDFALSATASSNLAVTFSTTSDKITIAGNLASIVKKGRATITASQDGNSNFDATSVDRSFCINPVKPVVSVSGVTPDSTRLNSNAITANQWYVNGTLINGATGTSFMAKATGTYTVDVSADDCHSFSDGVALVITGDISGSSGEMEAYPNPAESYVQISGLTEPVQSLQAIDMLGRGNTLIPEKNADTCGASVQHLTSGVYVLRVQTATSVHQIKLIKR